MTRKLSIFLFFVILFSAMMLPVAAEPTYPTTLGTPEHFVEFFDQEQDNYEQKGYETEIRYALELINYKQSGRTDTIYGPFLNVYSYNMPSQTNASQQATDEIKKAVANDLYPEKLNGTDLTKPITRAKFAAVALKLYETLSKQQLQQLRQVPLPIQKIPTFLKHMLLKLSAESEITNLLLMNL